MKAEQLLGLKVCHQEYQDQWYDWLVNEELPKRGEQAMNDFITCGFDPSIWMIWELYKTGNFNHKDSEFLNKLKESFVKIGLINND